MDAAGRTASNSSLWARPTSSTSRACVRYIRVRTTCSAPSPSSRSAASATPKAVFVCSYGPPSAILPSTTDVQPATRTRPFGSSTARE